MDDSNSKKGKRHLLNDSGSYYSKMNRGEKARRLEDDKQVLYGQGPGDRKKMRLSKSVASRSINERKE